MQFAVIATRTVIEDGGIWAKAVQLPTFQVEASSEAEAETKALGVVGENVSLFVAEL